ncbi:MAG: hypothetical protein PPFGHCPK_00349 [Spiroplasma endosymbiont of Drosophila atripex]|nr:MAG: hypothetical protein PPFGHCPK_00349 [Spiroplasma endosymbiont of Drosophila atripex]
MKYFNPNYLFKLWILIGPFFNNKVQYTNTMSTDNEIDCNNTFDITSIKNLIYNQIELETIAKELILLNRNKRAKGKSGGKGKINIKLKNKTTITKNANKGKIKKIKKNSRKITRKNSEDSNKESGTSETDKRNIEEKSLKKRKPIIFERKDNDKAKDFVPKPITINGNDILNILKLTKKKFEHSMQQHKYHTLANNKLKHLPQHRLPDLQ